MDAIREKLVEIEKEYDEITEQLMSSDIVSDLRKLTALSKRQAQLKGAVDAWHALHALDERIEQAQEMERLGVDLIIGDHPHVLQPIEYIGDMPVVYSLGNYLFTSFTLDTGVVRVTFSPSSGGMTSLQFIPMLQSGTRVRTSEGAEKARILQEMRSMSATASFDEDGYVTPK